MADQKIEIKLVIAEEVSRQLAPLAAEIKAFHTAAASGAERVHGSMNRLGGVVRVVHREFSTLARLTLGGIVGGGVVAGIVATSKALGDMARQGMQLRYQAEALGTTPQFLERMSDGLLALGVDAATAARDVQSVMGTLRDAETHGTKSSLFKALEHGVGGSGIRLWNQIKQQMAGPEGAEGAFKWLIGRMQNMAPTGQRAMLKALGISSLAFKDLKEVLPQLHKRIQLLPGEMQSLAVANANWQIEIGNVGRILGSALMPAIEKITTSFSKYLQSDAGKKFTKEISEWAGKIGDAVAGWISDKGPDGLDANLKSLKTAIGSLQEGFNAADKVIKDMGGSWTGVFTALVATGFVVWLGSLLMALRAIAPFAKTLSVLVAAYYAAKWFKEWSGGNEREKVLEKGPRLEDIPGLTPEQRENLSRGPKRYYFPGGDRARPQPQSGEGAPKTDQERRADIENENRERTALLTEMKSLGDEVGHVVDYFGIGGPEGSADGRSGFGAGVGGGFDIPDANIILSGSRSRPSASGGASWSMPSMPTDPRRLQRALERIAPGSDEEWELRKERVLKSLDPSMAGTAPSQWQGGTLPGPDELKRTERELESRRREYEKDPYYDNPGHMQERRDLLYNQGTFGQYGTPGMPINFRGGTTNLFGGDTVIRSLAAEGGGGGGAMNGSATVDIDVGGLGRPARNPDELFKPQPLDGAIQMQNVTHQPNNRLSFQ
jgi:hypothetical protein